MTSQRTTVSTANPQTFPEAVGGIVGGSVGGFAVLTVVLWLVIHYHYKANHGYPHRRLEQIEYRESDKSYLWGKSVDRVARRDVIRCSLIIGHQSSHSNICIALL